MRKIINIPTAKGNIVGVLHETHHGNGAGKLVIFQVAGLKNKIGPAQLYVRFAERLAQNGICAFRYDPVGIGDSDGFLEGNRKVLHTKIQNGCFVDDLVAVVQYFSTRFKEIYYFGLCGGAVTSMLALKEFLPSGILLIGFPTTLDDIQAQKEDVTEEFAEKVLPMYIKKIFSIQAWKRFATFQTDYRLLLKILLKKLKKKQEKSSDQVFHDPAFNAKLLSVMKIVEQKKIPLYLAFGELDRHYWDFQRYFMNPNFRIHEWEHVTLEILPLGNHELTYVHWQDWFIQRAIQWIGNMNEQ